MVERRMRAAICKVSSAWYTAWVNAGQPNLDKLGEPVVDPIMIQKEDKNIKKIKNIKGHEN